MTAKAIAALDEKCVEMRARLHNYGWESRRDDAREREAFRLITKRLGVERRAIEREEYVTRMYGCDTSWRHITEYARYFIWGYPTIRRRG